MYVSRCMHNVAYNVSNPYQIIIKKYTIRKRHTIRHMIRKHTIRKQNNKQTIVN